VKEKEIKRVLKIQAEQILQFEACEEYKQAIKGLQGRRASESETTSRRDGLRRLWLV